MILHLNRECRADTNRRATDLHALDSGRGTEPLFPQRTIELVVGEPLIRQGQPVRECVDALRNQVHEAIAAGGLSAELVRQLEPVVATIG